MSDWHAQVEAVLEKKKKEYIRPDDERHVQVKAVLELVAIEPVLCESACEHLAVAYPKAVCVCVCV